MLRVVDIDGTLIPNVKRVPCKKSVIRYLMVRLNSGNFQILDFQNVEHPKIHPKYRFLSFSLKMPIKSYIEKSRKSYLGWVIGFFENRKLSEFTLLMLKIHKFHEFTKNCSFLGKGVLGSSLNHSLELGWNEILISLDFISISNNFLSIWNCCPGCFVLPGKGGWPKKRDSYLTFFRRFWIFSHTWLPLKWTNESWIG